MVWAVRDQQLQIRTEFPHKINEIEHVWIPMSDGVRLAARIWLPEDAERNPVPALLEYIPYRKNDFTALRDSIRHPYFAGHGYASVRVDLRGSGDSEGLLLDEYLKQEQDDALEVIEWLTQQPWCSGAVGMFGKSWGGFNALQVAARRPAALKAILTICSTDDRYATDVHYMGGCLLASDMLWWAAYMLAYNGRPPDPKYVGDNWGELWLDRLEKTPPYVESWVRHQTRDAFWQHGSVCEDFAAIECPVFAVGGWSDGYTDAVFRLLEGLTSPKLGLIGPWAHEYPEVAIPGPAIGFLQEALRWWDHWLKGIDTGIMQEPMLRAYLQESAPPQPIYDWRAGKWVAEKVWKKEDTIEKVALQLGGWGDGGIGRLVCVPPISSSPHHPIPIPSRQTHGLHGGVWCPFGSAGDWATDQRADDALATCFEGEVATSAVDYLGFPEAILTLSADKPNALVALRLCDVAADGASTLVSVGLLNLTHRHSHEFPSLLEPGKAYTVTIRMNAIGYTLLPGHHWRLAIAPTLWNRAWPSPEAVTLTLHQGSMSLPVRSAKAEDEEVHFLPPEAAAVMKQQSLRGDERQRIIQHDLVNGVTHLIDYADDGMRRLLPDGIEFDSVIDQTFSIKDDDPLSAEVVCDFNIELGRGEWHTKVETSSTMHADAEMFYLSTTLSASVGETQIFNRTQEVAIPRNFV